MTSKVSCVTVIELLDPTARKIPETKIMRMRPDILFKARDKKTIFV